MSGGTNLARLEAEAAGLAGLRAGATGQAAVSDPAELLAELRHQQRNRSWDEATPLLHDAAQAYREVCGPRVQAQPPEPGRGSTFL